MVKKQFSAILELAAFFKTCEKNYVPNFLNFVALIFIQNVAKNKNIQK
jgi:hypothetical protein